MMKLFTFLILLGLSTSNILGREIVLVGAKTFPEQYIFGEIISQSLEGRGYRIERRYDLSTEKIRPSFEQGLIDIYVEYSGTGKQFYVGEDPEKYKNISFDELKLLEKKQGYIWGESAPFSNGWAFITLKKEYSQISQLSGVNTKIAMIENFVDRPDGIKFISSKYKFGRIENVTAGHYEIFEYLKRNLADFGIVYETDPLITQGGFTVLEDDLGGFTKYFPTLVYHEKFSQKFDFINRLIPLVTLPEMQKMISNYEKDETKRNLTAIAKKWLSTKVLK